MTRYLSADEDQSLEAELPHTMYYLMILKVGLFDAVHGQLINSLVVE